MHTTRQIIVDGDAVVVQTVTPAAPIEEPKDGWPLDEAGNPTIPSAPGPVAHDYVRLAVADLPPEIRAAGETYLAGLALAAEAFHVEAEAVELAKEETALKARLVQIEGAKARR